MKKRLLSALLCGILAAGMLTGCGGSDAKDEAAEDKTTSQSSEQESQEEESSNKTGIDAQEAANVTVDDLLNHEVTPASDFEYEISYDYEYSETEEICEITAYLGTDPVVVIPDEIEGHKVTSVGQTFAYGLDDNGNGANVVALKFGANILHSGGYSFLNYTVRGEESHNKTSIRFLYLNDNLKTVDENFTYGCDDSLEYVRIGSNLGEVCGLVSAKNGYDLYLPDDFIDTVAYTEAVLGYIGNSTIHVNANSSTANYLLEHQADDGNETFNQTCEECGITLAIE